MVTSQGAISADLSPRQPGQLFSFGDILALSGSPVHRGGYNTTKRQLSIPDPPTMLPIQ